MPREISIVPYDASWPERYEEERQLLKGIFMDLALEIHHFGSTSVPGLSAKPIIDIMIIASDLDRVDALNKVMESHGYTARGENGIPGRRYFVKMNPDMSGNHTHHVHIYKDWNPHIADELLFRDYLRIDREAALLYEQVKKKSAEAFRHDPEGYTKSKSACVLQIMDKARDFFKNRQG